MKRNEQFPFDSFPGNKIPRKWWLHTILNEGGIFVQPEKVIPCAVLALKGHKS